MKKKIKAKQLQIPGKHTPTRIQSEPFSARYLAAQLKNFSNGIKQKTFPKYKTHTQHTYHTTPFSFSQQSAHKIIHIELRILLSVPSYINRVSGTHS